jgi:hypothetical protein
MAKNKNKTMFLHAGGRTLSRMGKTNKPSSHMSPKKKATWYENFGKKYGVPAIRGSWPEGEPPEEVRIGRIMTEKK